MSRGPARLRTAREFEVVGSVLDEVLQGLKLKERFAAAAATDHWSEVVGPDVARRTRCVGVRDGQLLVEAEGAVWMGHLAVLRGEIQERINERLAPEERIHSIRLVPMRWKEDRGLDATR